jgi:hypothetical protein
MSARFRAQLPGLVSGQLSATAGGGAGLGCPGFLPPFGAPAFASWASCSHREFRPPRGRPTSPLSGWTLTGFPRSAHPSRGRIRRPLYPGASGAPTTDSFSPVAACRLFQRPRPCHPGVASHHPRLSMTRHHRGFTCVRPPGLPLARLLPRMVQGPLGFFPGLRTCTGRTCRARQGGDGHRALARSYTTDIVGPPICELTRDVRPRVARRK